MANRHKEKNDFWLVPVIVLGGAVAALGVFITLLVHFPKTMLALIIGTVLICIMKWDPGTNTK